MKPRKTRDLVQAMEKKGFVNNPSKDHHQYYCLYVNGRKSNIYTYISHGLKEYNSHLMGKIKKQLKFPTAQDAESFFDCPMSGDEYVEMLQKESAL